MVKRAFLIHGWTGTPDIGWFPWMKNELEKKGFQVYAPLMPDTDHPKMDAWVEHLTKIVGTPDENCYFIGHSLGCITVLRYLETLKKNQTVGGVVLVAGFSSNLSSKYDEVKHFTSNPVNWDKIKSHCKKFVAIHSDDDYVVPLSHGDVFKEKLGAKLIVQHNMEHFTAGAGIIELPVALESILEMSK